MCFMKSPEAPINEPTYAPSEMSSAVEFKATGPKPKPAQPPMPALPVPTRPKEPGPLKPTGAAGLKPIRPQRM